MSLKIGFFYRMDANTFSSVNRLRKRYNDAECIHQVSFIPILEIKENDVGDFESCLNQIRKYIFLMKETVLDAAVEFDSFKIIEQSKLIFTGRYDLSVIGEILIDLKILLANRFKNELIPFSERFNEPQIVGIDRFSCKRLDEILTEVNDRDLYRFNVKLVHLGYVDYRDSKNIIFNNSSHDGAKTNDSEEFEYH